MNPETSTGGPHGGLNPTLWTLILKAKDPPSEEQRRAALNQLILIYWKPAYFFIRRRGHDVEESKDLTQAFFATFLEKDYLKDVDPERGRFRSFLLASLSHFLSNEFDRRNAKKRGGDFNFVEAEGELASSSPRPEEAFFNRWTLEVMGRAMDRLKSERNSEDVALLSGETPSGMPVHEKKNRLHRMRRRLRTILIEEILPSVSNEREALAELHEILAQNSRRI